MTTPELMVQLFTALEAYGEDSIRALVEIGAGPSSASPGGLHPLHALINNWRSFMYPQKAKLVLDRVAQVDAKNESCVADLENCIRHCVTESLSLVDAFLDYGTDVTAKDGTPPLIVSAYKTAASLLLKLVEKGAPVNIRDTEIDSTALRLAVFSNSSECVKTLLRQRDIDVIAKDGEGFTLFHYAVQHNLLDVMCCLLEHGAVCTDSILANVSKLSCDGKFVEFTAEPLKGISIPVSKHGIDINLKVSSGRSALHLAVDHVDMVEAVLSLGADINLADDMGFTPLMYSIAFSDHLAGTDEVLLRNGADVNARCRVPADMTALFLVFDYYTREDRVALLLEYGADVNFTTNASSKENTFPKRTALLYAEEKVKGLFLYRDRDRCPLGEDYEWKSLVNLCRYIISLKTANEFSVIETNLQSKYLSHPSLLGYQTDCEKELKKLRSVMVADSNFSFYDFLTRKPNVLARASKRVSVASFLESEEHPEAFPVYETLLKWRFRMAIERSGLIDDAVSAGLDIFPTLPIFCVDAICEYLQNVDLKNFIEAGRILY